MLVKSVVACYNKCRKKRPMTASFRMIRYILFITVHWSEWAVISFCLSRVNIRLQRPKTGSRQLLSSRQVAQAKKNRPNSCRFFVLSRKQTGRRVALCGGFVDIDRAEKMPQSGRLNKSVRPSPFRGKDTAAGLLLPRTFQLQYIRRRTKEQTTTLPSVAPVTIKKQARNILLPQIQKG